MAENGAGAARQNGCGSPVNEGDRDVADGVDAGVLPDQATGGNSMADRAASEAQREQLLPGYEAPLAPRQRSNLYVNRLGQPWSAAFCPITGPFAALQ